MQTESLKCGGCGAAIERPAAGSVAKCPYCLTEQVLPAGTERPARPEDLAASLTKARETMDKMMGTAFPAARSLRTVVPIVALVIFAIVVLRMLRMFFSMH